MSETHDAQGREVFTVHPEILAGGAPYRPLKAERPPAGQSDGKDTAAGEQPKTR